MDDLNSKEFPRMNMAIIIGYWSALNKSICLDLELTIDHWNKWPASKNDLIKIVEKMKMTQRLTDYIFEHRHEKVFWYPETKEIEKELKETFITNENGRTIKLDVKS